MRLGASRQCTEKEPSMAVSAIHQPRTYAPVITIDRFSIPETSAAMAAPSKDETEMDSRAIAASAAGLGCVRGTSLALMCEAVAVLSIYAIWQLVHLLH